eukprot:7154811-Pyramimonas_sp.AAC.1
MGPPTALAAAVPPSCAAPFSCSAFSFFLSLSLSLPLPLSPPARCDDDRRDAHMHGAHEHAHFFTDTQLTTSPAVKRRTSLLCGCSWRQCRGLCSRPRL